MGEENCRSCMVYKQGDCIGREICDMYRPAPTSGVKKYWPKVRRSKSSYAGTADSKYVYPKQSNKDNDSSNNLKSARHAPAKWKKRKNYAEALDIKRKRIENPGAADAILSFLSVQVIAWISYDEMQVASGTRYVPKCLLQFKNHILQVECQGTEKDATRAMFRGMAEAANHITKACTVNYVLDRAMFDGINVYASEKDDDLLLRTLTLLEKKECHITEIIVKQGTDLIKKQIEHPVTSVISSSQNADVVVIEEENIRQQNAPQSEVEHTEDGNDYISQDLANKLSEAMNSGKDVIESKESIRYKKTENSEMGGIRITCRVCNRVFAMSSSEVEFYKKKGFQLPRRCEECRERHIRYSDNDYYERGLKHNSYQRALDTYGGRTGINGPAQSEGYTSLY